MVGGATVATMTTSGPVAVPATAHPVMQVLRERARTASQPGARADRHRVALVLEGGGMRGVVSAGMTAALERLGMSPRSTSSAGSSAGAINGAALIAGVARARRGDLLRAARLARVRQPVRGCSAASR